MSNRKQIRRFCSRGLRTIKTFLSQKRSREVFVYSIFVLIAFIFWVMQTLNNKFEKEFTLPLMLINVPKNVVITSELPTHLRFKVRDRGTELIRYELSHTLTPLILNFADFEQNNGIMIVSSTAFQTAITEQLYVGSELIDITPAEFKLYFSVEGFKKIPLKLAGKLQPATQYFIVDTLFTPDSVWVHAPKSVLDTLHTAYTTSVFEQELKETKNRKVGLKRVVGAKFSPNQVNVSIEVDMLAKKSVQVPIVGVHFPPHKILRTFPSTVQVDFLVGINDYNKIEASDFALEVDFDSLVLNVTDKWLLKLTKVPTRIKSPQMIPNEVDFLIETTSNGR